MSVEYRAAAVCGWKLDSTEISELPQEAKDYLFNEECIKDF